MLIVNKERAARNSKSDRARTTFSYCVCTAVDDDASYQWRISLNENNTADVDIRRHDAMLEQRHEINY